MPVAKRLLPVLLYLFCQQALALPLTLQIHGHTVSLELFSLFAAADEEIRLEVLSADAGRVELTMAGQPMGEQQGRVWSLRAPTRPGVYRLRMEQADSGAHTVLNLFVGLDASEIRDGELNGYRIGDQPPGHGTYPALYQRPQTFFEVTADNIDTPLTPHFTLRQFLCKQVSDYPKYVVLSESLLVLLEDLLQVVQEAGYPAQTFGVISGYRTPYYNKRIGNVPNSRHVYGDAMDFFVDVDRDGRMDDLNRDGEHNRADVDLLYQLIHEFKQLPRNALLLGGVGRYYKTRNHGGFVHVDARGFRARW